MYEVRDTDWVQAAVIPSDFLMAQIERHMDVYAAVVVAVMVLLGVLIGHLMKETRGGRGFLLQSLLPEAGAAKAL